MFQVTSFSSQAQTLPPDAPSAPPSKTTEVVGKVAAQTLPAKSTAQQMANPSPKKSIQLIRSPKSGKWRAPDRLPTAIRQSKMALYRFKICRDGEEPRYYYGETKRAVPDRLAEHLRAANDTTGSRATSQRPLYNFLRENDKHKINTVEFGVLGIAQSKLDLLQAETTFIMRGNSTVGNRGFNLRVGRIPTKPVEALSSPPATP